jgi:hypothetical protein
VSEETQLRLEEILRVIEAELVNESMKYGEDPFGQAVSSLLGELQETQRELVAMERL